MIMIAPCPVEFTFIYFWSGKLILLKLYSRAPGVSCCDGTCVLSPKRVELIFCLEDGVVQLWGDTVLKCLF